MPGLSIVIPVYNQWELTRACLKAVNATVPADFAEIIVVDNASSDPTPKGAPFLGRQLFGENFHFIRNDENRNFAGASNQGAAAAKGDYLVFLNNDTEVQPGWHEPLLQDFVDFPNLAGTGPLLVYPELPLLGHTVQHIGVCISPFYKVGHLYEGISAASPLAQKRRFFQIITAACLMMPRRLFKAIGGFDEAYINGFEDVDLCARLGAKGMRFTVNPAARVIHYQGQSQGRHDAENNNSAIMERQALPLLHPDKENLLLADGMSLGLNAWQIQVPLLPAETISPLDDISHKLDRPGLLSLLSDYPYWQEGWRKLIKMLAPAEMEALAPTLYKLSPEPPVPLAACERARERNDRKHAYYWFNTARVFSCTEKEYMDSARLQAEQALALGNYPLAKCYEEWIRTSPEFFKDKLQPFIAEMARVAERLKIPTQIRGEPSGIEQGQAIAIYN